MEIHNEHLASLVKKLVALANGNVMKVKLCLASRLGTLSSQASASAQVSKFMITLTTTFGRTPWLNLFNYHHQMLRILLQEMHD